MEKSHHQPKLHVDEKSDTKSQIYTAQQDATILYWLEQEELHVIYFCQKIFYFLIFSLEIKVGHILDLLMLYISNSRAL
jgi:hypothetical protein